MASKLPSAEQVQELLRQLQNPSTVKAASDYLRKYFKHPASMPVLFQLMRMSPHSVVSIWHCILSFIPLLEIFCSIICSVCSEFCNWRSDLLPDQVRQMSGVYLRKKLLSHWKKLDAEARHAIKIGALETLVQEQE